MTVKGGCVVSPGQSPPLPLPSGWRGRPAPPPLPPPCSTSASPGRSPCAVVSPPTAKLMRTLQRPRSWRGASSRTRQERTSVLRELLEDLLYLPEPLGILALELGHHFPRRLGLRPRRPRVIHLLHQLRVLVPKPAERLHQLDELLRVWQALLVLAAGPRPVRRPLAVAGGGRRQHAPVPPPALVQRGGVPGAGRDLDLVLPLLLARRRGVGRL